MSDRVINFRREQWHTREKLAELLGISVRTLYRRIDDGEIEVEDTPEGKRYRVAPQGEEQEVAAAATGLPDDKFATGGNVAGELFGLLREQLAQLGELRDTRGRLEAKLEASRGDVDRAVDYVAQLEDELDRVSAERGELADELQEERGRRLELEEQHAQVRAELHELTGVRAKFHLERGRREQAEHKLDELRAQLTDMHRQLDQLTHQLDDEQARRLKLALGSVSLEIRRASDD